jgi:hypothetical protein
VFAAIVLVLPRFWHTGGGSQHLQRQSEVFDHEVTICDHQSGVCCVFKYLLLRFYERLRMDALASQAISQIIVTIRVTIPVTVGDVHGGVSRV